MNRLEQVRTDFNNALNRLREAVETSKTELEIDGAIQRFEFTFELCWKTLKIFLKDIHGIECNSPKSCLKKAFELDIINDEKLWLKMVDARNASVHLYDKKNSRKIFDAIKNNYLAEFERIIKEI